MEIVDFLKGIPLVPLLSGVLLSFLDKKTDTESSLKKRMSFLREKMQGDVALKQLAIFKRYEAVWDTDEGLDGLRGDGVSQPDTILEYVKSDVRLFRVDIKLEIMWKVVSLCWTAITMSVIASVGYFALLLKFNSLQDWVWYFFVLALLMQLLCYAMVRIVSNRIYRYEDQI